MAAAAALSLTLLRDVDYWWQWSLGRLIDESGVPRTETFMHTRRGVETFSLSWGYCWGLYRLEQVVGVGGVVVVKCAAVLASIGVMMRVTALRAGVMAACAAGLMSVVIASQRFAVRPEVATYVLLALTLWVIAAAQGRRTRWVWALPVMALVWVNVHSTFVVQIVVIGVWVGSGAVSAAAARFAGERAGEMTRWTLATGAVVLAVCIAATLLNPYGVRAWEVPYRRLLAVLPEAGGRPLLVAGAAAAIGAVIAGTLLAGPAGRVWRNASRAKRRATAGIVLTAGVALGGAVLAGMDVWERARAPLNPDIERVLVSELRSPWSLGWVYTAVVWYRVAMVVVLPIGVASSWRRLGGLRAGGSGVFWVAMALGAAVVSSLAVRNLALFALCAMPVLGMGLSAAGRWVTARAERRGVSALRGGAVGRGVCAAVIGAASAVLVWEVVTDRFYVRQGDSGRFGIGVDEQTTARGAAAVVRQLGEKARPFNSERTGSPLMAAGVPVFIDSRAVGGILHEYVEVMRDPSAFRAVAQRYGINAAVVDVSNRGLLRLLAGEEKWRLVQLDEQTATFVRGEAARVIPTLDLERDGQEWLREVRGRMPEVRGGERGWSERVVFAGRYAALGRALWDLGVLGPARAMLEDAVRAGPTVFTDWEMLGVLRELDEDLDGAAGAYAKSLEGKRDWRVLVMAGSVALRRGDPAAAEGMAEEAYGLNPKSAEAVELGTLAAERRGLAERKRVWEGRGGGR